MSQLPEDLARVVKMVIIDVDGVMTDGGIYIGTTPDGQPFEMKRFEITDGLGVVLMRRAGLLVHVVSGRRSTANETRSRELEVPYREAHGGYKLQVVDEIRSAANLRWAELCCICDDLADLPIMKHVGLPVAVANGVPEIKAAARWITARRGGNGAVRELAEALLRARNTWDELVRDYEVERSGAPRDR